MNLLPVQAKRTALIQAVFAGVFAVLAMASDSEAAIIGVNVGGLGTSDDGFNITRDSGTNLDWLDLTLTQTENYNDVVGGSFYVTYGFQHATESQIAQLFINAGLVRADSTPVTSILASQASSIAPLTQAEFETLFDAIEILSILLGNTVAAPGGENGGSFGVTGTPGVSSNHSTAGIRAAYSPFTPSADNCWGAGLPSCDPLRHSLAIDLPLGSIADNAAGGQLGHFLVRATPTGIPEPATLALFVFGLAGLGVMRRRKAA